MNATKEKGFWAATTILVTTLVLMLVIVLNMERFSQIIGPFRLTHWFVWTGTLYIAIAVPIIAILKKHRPQKYKTLYRTHVFGNLLAFLLISLHFAGQISRSATSYPELGTGITLYAAMVLLVGTGFLQRFQLTPNVKSQSYRFIHMGAAVAFYLIIVIHILHGLGFI